VRAIDSEDPTYAEARRLTRRGGSRSIFSDEELIACLREAATVADGRLSIESYTRYAADRRLGDGRPWPSHQTALLRFGSWRAAVEEAGLPPPASAPRRLARRFDVERCVDAFVDVARALGHLPTAKEYGDAATSSRGRLPSLATVRHRVGSWRRALQAAAEKMRDGSAIETARGSPQRG
jgi:hypothetical protein